ncbi:hypothetical protein FSARC_3071 [Fusarium sarcochroum]|uniref:C2H2-type domain-containing protein n=1 Tax=Fusarium sarcochroum TaxID=1208366 RepID=A0A8H4U581_9HYPO|nr:hypothetical protein FSARC_3071 [Fusarium sarcochroum]
MDSDIPKITLTVWDWDNDMCERGGRRCIDTGCQHNARDDPDYHPSVNDLAVYRQAIERNNSIQEWLATQQEPDTGDRRDSINTSYSDDQADEIDETGPGYHTENKFISGQVYFKHSGFMRPQDYELVASIRNWGDAPMLSYIMKNEISFQPGTSQAAIEKFTRMVDDTGSTASRAATWGTQRVDLSNAADPDSEPRRMAGNILIQTQSEEDIIAKAPSDITPLGIQNKDRSPIESSYLKRNRSNSDGDRTQSSEDAPNKEAVHYSLLTPGPGWPSLLTPKTYLPATSRGANVPSVGSPHSHSESYSCTSPTSLRSPVDALGSITPVTSPKSTFSSLSASIYTKPLSENPSTWHPIADVHDSDDKWNGFPWKPADVPEMAPASRIERINKPEPRLDDKGPELQRGSNLCESDTSASDESEETILTHVSGIKKQVISMPQHQEFTKIPVPMTGKRQVGLARVKIDIISMTGLSGSSQSNHETSESSGHESEIDTEGSEEPTVIRTRAHETESGPPDRSDFTPPIRSSDGNRDTSSSSANSNKNQPGNSGDGDPSARRDPNERPQRRVPRPRNKKNTQRFACPYQVFEPWQGCFRPGPRNPSGGCAGIQRLKQHLSRRHMRSYRCTKCWKSFEKKESVGTHSSQQTPCRAREMPTTEKLMSRESEEELEELGCSRSAEETWLKMFQLLIPNMQDRDLQSLRSQFYPYYLYSGSLELPPISFPGAPFQLQQSVPTTATQGFEIETQVSQPSRLISPTITPSHTVYVPLLHAPASYQPSTEAQYLQFSTASQSVAPSQTPDSDPQTSTQTFPTSRSSEAAVSAPEEPLEHGRLRRHLDMLRARHSQAEVQISEFQEANRNAQAEVSRADEIVDDLLASAESLPSHVYDKLFEVSEILSTVKRKLR